MNNNLKGIVIFILSFMIFATTIFGNTPSEWAEAEISQALKSGLFTKELISDYQVEATREEFTKLIVASYEKIVDKEIDIKNAVNPFEDTDNEVVLKAYVKGFVNGTSKTEFSGNRGISREEIIVMIIRMNKTVEEELDIQILDLKDNATKFKDEVDISSWALESINVAYVNGIVEGYEDGLILPKRRITREQVILMNYRAYKNLMSKLPDPSKESTSKEGVVTCDILNLRKSSSTVSSNNIIGKLYYNEKVDIKGTDGDWYEVVTDNNIRGYVHSDFIKVNEVSVKKGFVTCSVLNFRETPTTESSDNIIGKLYRYEQVVIKDSVGDWYEAVSSDDISGYVHSDFISLSEKIIYEKYAEDYDLDMNEVSETVLKSQVYTVEQLHDYDFITRNIYNIHSKVKGAKAEFDMNYYLTTNMKLEDDKNGPKILIYHTHSQEEYESTNGRKTVVDAGNDLTRILEEDYGIEVYHLTKSYDLVDGKLDRSKAYDLILPDLKEILKDNPSIDLMIDLHRDGVPENVRLVTKNNGKPTARIMFFNALGKVMENGELVEVDYLANPYVKDNMALSLQIQLKAKELYPGFTRNIYVRDYRYNLHLLPKSMLIEVGAQNNTYEEAKNAMTPLAHLLYEVTK